MANIYEPKSEDLHDLIDRASNANGTTVVIPDLQRPYVWDPTQVTLLIDSLIRGWPFGTLLMWKVDHNDLGSIPHREFWQVVDRTESAAGATVTRRDPPASYHMVLDGQQRVQSLLLALCGDGWGFKQEDRVWLEQLEGVRPRGRRPTNPHWSKGTLCFDVPQFLAAYQESKDVIGIDYRNVLCWAVTDPNNGESTWAKPTNYRNPIQKAFAPENKGRFLRLGRLWSSVLANPNLRERQFKDAVKPVLEEHSVDPQVIEKVLDPMGELMSVLRDVKLSKITYLELRPYDEALWEQDEYNEAIVNIFTRLNTAGRTLTREEITFAWLKVGWDSQATAGKTAGDCFEALLTLARDKGLPIRMDDLVRAVSFIWATTHCDGNLLSDKDLLKGDTVRPMAGDLSAEWSDIVRSLETVLQTAKDHDLRYGQNGQYNSNNALIVIWCSVFSAYRWLRTHPQNTVATDSFNKSLEEHLDNHIDRWMICSHWAGLWASSSGTVLVTYAKELSRDHAALTAATDPTVAIQTVSGRFKSLTDGIAVDAAAYVQSLSVDKREQVSRYNTLLWVWHRLDTDRWAMSRIPLRAGKQKVCDLEVDHTVAFRLWTRLVEQIPPADDEQRQELLAAINQLGNCTLLEKSFNISKSDKPLKKFLGDVHEFKTGKVEADDWCSKLKIAVCQFDPDAHSVDVITKAIADRDAMMRKELVAFVQGSQRRQDLAEDES